MVKEILNSHLNTIREVEWHFSLNKCFYIIRCFHHVNIYLINKCDKRYYWLNNFFYYDYQSKSAIKQSCIRRQLQRGKLTPRQWWSFDRRRDEYRIFKNKQHKKIKYCIPPYQLSREKINKCVTDIWLALDALCRSLTARESNWIVFELFRNKRRLEK